MRRHLVMAVGAGPEMARRLPLRDLRDAWAEGLPRLAAVAGVDLIDAARLAWEAGLVPRRWRLGLDELTVLATETMTSNTELGRRLGVSRWAVATWRERLGLERNRDGAPTAAGAGVTVADLRLGVGPRVSLDGPGGPYPLGAAAQRILRVLAEHHPDPVTPDLLATAIAPDDDPALTRRAIHSTIWRLRRSLPPGTICTEDGHYRLGLDAAHIDRP